MNPKIVFLGTPTISAIVLEKLIESPFRPELVITGRPKKTGRSQQVQKTPVEDVAIKNKIKTSYDLTAIDNTFDVAILIAYGKIIPDSVLKKPKFGFVNIHPSLLPKYRGASPVSSSILNGDTTTGVTLILLDSELDHGPQIAQETLDITADDTTKSLSEKLALLGAELILKTLPAYLEQDITPEPQDHNNATYCEKLTKDSGKLNLSDPPTPQKISNMIRAYHPWPGTWFESNGKRFKLLPGKKIQPEGKKPMTSQEFKNGYPKIAELISGITS